MRVLVETKGMDRETWKEYRKKGLGGSDASAAVGVNPYKSPIVLYMEKTGQYTPPEPGEAAYWGNMLEDVVANEFIKRYNEGLLQEWEQLTADEGLNVPFKEARIQRRNAILMHDEHDFMLMNVDRFLFCPVKGKGILECKTASAYLADEWKGEDIPDQYYVQVQHYLAITGLNYAYVAVLIGGQKFSMYYIERDEEFIQNLIRLESEFWHRVTVSNIPPAIDGSDSTSEMYKLMYPDSKEYPEPFEFDSEGVSIVAQRQYYKTAMESSEEQKKTFENMIKSLMEDRELAFAGNYKITWKTNKKGVRPLVIKEVK